MNVTGLVLSGGGVKGIATLGALEYFYEKNKLDNVKTFVGTSVGAVIAAFICIGFTPRELYSVVENFNMSDLTQHDFLQIIKFYGIDDGSRIEDFLESLFKKKDCNKITFKELYERFDKDLIITGTCLNETKLYYFNKDDFPDMQIQQAVRISMSIPFYFVPYNINGKLFVDGGCMNNFPIDKYINRDDFVGILLCSDNPDRKITNIEDYLCAVFSCIGEGMDIASSKYKNVIRIICENINSVDFSICLEKKEELFHYGYAAALNFMTFN